MVICILMIKVGGDDFAALAFMPLLFGMVTLFIATVLFALRALNRAEDHSEPSN